MGKFDKYIDKKCNDKTKKKIKEEFSTYEVFFHPKDSLVMLDTQPNRLRVYYDTEDDTIVEITEG